MSSWSNCCASRPKLPTSLKVGTTATKIMRGSADGGTHVRDAARLDRISLLNKPLKPASLRALIGQWRAQQAIAAAE